MLFLALFDIYVNYTPFHPITLSEFLLHFFCYDHRKLIHTNKSVNEVSSFRSNSSLVCPTLVSKDNGRLQRKMEPDLSKLHSEMARDKRLKVENGIVEFDIRKIFFTIQLAKHRTKSLERLWSLVSILEGKKVKLRWIWP